MQGIVRRMEQSMRLSAEKRVKVVIDAAAEFIGTNFVVRNKNNFPWKNVRVELNSNTNNGSFIFKAQEFPARKTRTIGMGEFVDQAGTKLDSLPRSITGRPQSLGIRCETQLGGGFWLGTFV